MSIHRQICGIAMLMALPTQGQDDEHPFIKSFKLTELDGRIQVEWTMAGGSTCDGTEVERSTDGASWTVVHGIEGICGDPILDVPFAWQDTDPPEFSTVYYRIRLGFAGYSSVKSIDFIQLSTSDQRFFPSPMTGEATLLLDVPASARVDLLIFDASGRSVLERTGLQGREHRIVLHNASPGVYTYLAISSGRRFQGRFIKAGSVW